MTTKRNTGKCLWCWSVVFISYLLIGSFIVSGNILDLIYLVTLYSCLIIQKIIDVKKGSSSEDE